MARLFISYTKQDQPQALRLRDALRAADHEAWIDVDEILVGESIPAAVARGLEQSDYVVQCLSTAARESN